MRNLPGTRKCGNVDQRGMSLVELMVALALGVVLVGGITQVYLENKKNYVQDEELARLQENGRFVLNLFKRELKMAGFLAGATPGNAPGQLDPGGPITSDCSNGWALDPTYGVDFINSVAQGASTSSIIDTAANRNLAGCITEANVVPGTDIIALKRLAGMATIQNGVYASEATGTSEEKKKSYYIKLTDLEPSFEYVDTAGFSADVLSTTNTIGMWLYMAKVFYIRNYSVTPGDGIPTLTMISLQDKSMVETPLVEGVEDMHIEFGIPDSTACSENVCDRTPVLFTDDPTIGDISGASVARVYLLLRTRNPIRNYTDTKTYSLGSKAAYTPGGNFMRRVFTTTIKLRN